MSDDTLRDALAEIRDLFSHRQAALDPWTSDHYDYDDGYTSGLAQAIAIIEAHMNAQPDP
ncbi:hypothetical protein [Bifidobacterium sp. AGR2158]|uniref:hypothetical protein n=1 Tax=Bifidobacterium sp. AGR2158 TaxID=1280675 RepID=UPI000403102C|nr:hypothetical protein [Bifidobacterium sp. AGR2158]